MCLNKRVVAGVAVVALALLVVAPRLLIGAAPLLLLAICPLSMVFMMRTMSGRSDDAAPNSATAPQRDPGRELREMEEEVNRLKAELALRGEDRRA